MHRSQNPDVALRHEHIADGNPTARLRIKMHDGNTHDVELGPAHHLTGDDVLDKFRITAGHVFGAENIGQAVQLVGKLEDLDSTKRLMDVVTLGR